jgi:hypothetical protein
MICERLLFTFSFFKIKSKWEVVLYTYIPAIYLTWIPSWHFFYHPYQVFFVNIHIIFMIKNLD